MADWFLDPINGNDSNDGTTFANRKKSLSGFNSTALAAGDTVRLIASPAPTNMGQQATFTNISLTITLTSAVTANITDCSSAWTGSAGVTAALVTTTNFFREGNQSISLAIGGGYNYASTPIVGYFNTGTLDLSPYQQVSFWIKSTVNQVAGKFAIRLSTTTNGTTSTHQMTLPAVTANQWQAITVDNGSAFNSSIQSVALIALSAPAAGTIYLDNILACKNPGAPDSLTLNSLIGKNTNNDGWFPIRAINDTSVVVDMYTSSTAGTGKGYSGTTETVDAWKLEPLIPDTAVYHTSNKSGISGNPITLSGGWDTTDMSTQNQGGVIGTFISGLNCTTSGFTVGNYWNIQNLGVVRYLNGIILNNSGHHDVTIDNCQAIGCNNGIGTPANLSYNHILGANGPLSAIGCSVGFLIQTTHCYLGNLVVKNFNAEGVILNCGNVSQIQGTSILCSGGINTGFIIGGPFNILTDLTCRDNNYGLGLQYCADSHIWKYTSLDNVSGSSILANNGGGSIVIHNANMNEAVIYVGEWLGLIKYSGSKIISVDEQTPVSTKCIWRCDNGTIQLQSSIFPPGASTAWQFSPTSTNSSDYTLGGPHGFVLASVLVPAGKTLTFTAKVYLTNSGISGQLRILGGIYPGINSDLISFANTALTNQWQDVSIQCTPTDDRVIDIIAEAYGGSSYSAYFGRVSKDISP